MAQPVWVLSVDLQTKTATFQSGMAEAAKSARGSFQEIKEGASTMGRETGRSMRETRESVVLLGEEFGVHLPRALTSFIASLGPIGAAMEAAFPFIAIVAGAVILLEHLEKLRKEGQELTQAQMSFGTTIANVLNGLDDKLLQAGIRTDELNHNHLAALNKQLQLIDHASMDELVKSFDSVAKAADATLGKLKASWLEEGKGSEGAKHALEDFQQKYDLLLAEHKDKEAGDLLAGTLRSAQRVLDLQKQARDSQANPDKGQHGDYSKYEAAMSELRKQNITLSDKEFQSQQVLVDALNAQVQVQQKVNQLKHVESSNAIQTEQERDIINLLGRHGNALTELAKKQQAQAEAAGEAQIAANDVFARAIHDRLKLQDEAAKIGSEHLDRMAELELASEREKASLTMSAHRVTDAERLAQVLQEENQEYSIKRASLQRQVEELDRSDKDYENKLKALQNRQLELVREHENKVTQIKDQAEKDRNKRILSAEQQFDDTIARSMASTLTRHQSAGQMLISIGNTIAQGMIQNAIKSIMADDMTKPHDAAHAARKAFIAGEESVPGWPGVILGAALAAGAFASVMAFAEGGIVPGVGKGDIVPAKLEPGETVIPKQMTERLQRASNTEDTGRPIHVHGPRYNIQAVDATGVHAMLEKHSDEFHRHFTKAVRKMNR